MALMVVTINNPSPAMAFQAQEVQFIARCLDLAELSVRAAGGKLTSGNILAEGGSTVLGSWTYIPVASS